MSDRIGNCSECGNDAAWNTPCITEDGDVLCNTCAYESKEVVQGIEQYKENGEYVRVNKWFRQGAVVWNWNNYVAAWYDKGSRRYYMSQEEQDVVKTSPEVILDQIVNMRRDKVERCSSCGIHMAEHEVAGYPLFAGVACSPCYKEHREATEEQRRKGHVCRMCRKPWNDCCC